MALGTAFRAFFAALRGGEPAAALERVLNEGPGILQKSGGDTEEPKNLPAPKPPAPVKPLRSEAITLLSMLQREARFVDLVQEPLDGFSDAQVGAAARPCLLQCRQIIARAFDLQPVLAGEEGSRVSVPENASPLKIQHVGASSSSASTATLVHHGWYAGRCELAQWTGDSDAASVIAPAQVQD